MPKSREKKTEKSQLDALEDILKGIQTLHRARELLSKIWLEAGPYQTGKIEEKTWMEIEKYFHFDDSE